MDRHVTTADILRHARGETLPRWLWIIGINDHIDECTLCWNKWLMATAILRGESWFAQEYQPDAQDS